MQFDRGFKSPYFVTDNSTMTAVLNDPLILITDKKLNTVKELLPILEACSSQNKALLVVADSIDGEALSTLVVNKMRGILPCIAVNAPDFGDRKKAVLEDIATLTGGTVVSQEKGMRLDKFDVAWLGKANKVTATKDKTTIIDAKGKEEAIEARVEEIKAQIEDSNSPFEKETLQGRLAKFVGGVSIVYVGGYTEIEMKEKKDRVDDALQATKAAMEEGVVEGGGIALLRTIKEVAKLNLGNEAEQNGVDVILSALESPFRQILINGGWNVEDGLGHLDGKGFNAKDGTYVDMFEAGIIDPKKVTRTAIQNASSVVGMILTTECMIVDKPSKEEKVAQKQMLMG